MKEILVQFVLKYGKSEFTFWSSVLETTVESANIGYLNKDNETKIAGYDNIIIEERFSSADNIESLCKDYAARPPVFLKKDKTFQKGSPYKYCCAELANFYYKKDFQSELAKFFIGAGYRTFSDFNAIQEEVITTIKNIIGIDIIKQQSIPGCISKYQRLPVFQIDANYNADNGRRFVKVMAEEYQSGDVFLIDVEITDDDKVLYRQAKEFSCQTMRMDLPNRNELEDFSDVHFTVLKKDGGSFIRQYEETGLLIRSFNLNFSVGGGSSRLVRNRFLNNKLESVPMREHEHINGMSKKMDWFYLERDYKKALYGKDKEFLESHFFGNDDKGIGRKQFLDWTRNKLQSAGSVIVIDPFFDINGLNDFIACTTAGFKLTLLTTDPNKTKREDANEAKKDDGSALKKHLLDRIYSNFRNADVYFADRKDLHDRFFIIENAEETVCFSMSNSWNGTVNNYSLLVQELSIKEYLAIKDSYAKYFDTEHLQKKHPKKETEDAESCDDKHKEWLDKNTAKAKLNELNEWNSNISNEEFKCSVVQLVNSDLEDYEIVLPCSKKTELVQDIYSLIDECVRTFLTEQKHNFQKSGHCMDGESIEGYGDFDVCFKRTHFYEFMHGYRGLYVKDETYRLLEICFAAKPKAVIDALIKQEQEICVIKATDKDDKQYFVSEITVLTMLSELYLYIADDKDARELSDFANKTDNLYCKAYIANWVISSDMQEDFSKMIEDIQRLGFDKQKVATILSSIYCNKNRFGQDKEKKEEYLSQIEQYVLNNFAADKNALAKFAIRAYILSDNIEIFRLENLLEKHDDVKKEVHKFILLYALQNVPSRKLSEYVEKTSKDIDTSYLSYLMPSNGCGIKKTSSIVDVGKFINIIPYLGKCLNEIARDNSKNKEKLIYKFGLDKNIIFGTFDYRSDMEFAYYVLLIIAVSFFMPENNDGKWKDKMLEEFKEISWYVPYMLNTCPNDFYGLSYQFAELYTLLMTGEENKKLLDTVSDINMKLFIAASIPDVLFDESGRVLYKSVLSDYKINDYDNQKSAAYLLNIFIRLVFIEGAGQNRERSYDILQMIKKLLGALNGKKINEAVDAGIEYAKTGGQEEKGVFSRKLKEVYWPYSAVYFAEEYGK